MKHSILHVLGMDNVGGAENHVSRFIQATHQRIDHDLIVVNEQIHSSYRNALSDHCDITHWKYRWGLKLPTFLRSIALRSWLKGRRYTAAFCYSQLTKPALIRTIQEQLDCILTYYDEGASWDHGREKSFLMDLYDRYIAASNGSEIILKQKFSLNREHIYTIPNAMPVSQFDRISAAPTPKTPDLNPEEEIPNGIEDRTRVLYLGRLTHQKGVHVLIRALSRLSSEFHLMIVGDGVRMKRLRDLAKRMNLHNKITFAGFQQDPVPYLKWSDVMVVPSIREPFGLVVQEAGAAGIPVIASQIDGIPDMVTHGESGLLIEPTVPVNRWPEEVQDYDVPECVVNRDNRKLMSPKLIDPVDLADALERIRRQPDQAKKMGNRLEETIRNQFLLPAVLDRYDRFLDSFSDNSD